MREPAREPRAFMLRLKPGKIDRLKYALEASRLFVGWSEAEGLDNPTLGRADFRDIVQDAYGYTPRQAGQSTGTLRRFIRDMGDGDLVAVPAGSSFYLAKAGEPVDYDNARREDDTSWYRPCEWLNDRRPIARADASDALAALLGARHTCLDATDLLEELRRLSR